MKRTARIGKAIVAAVIATGAFLLLVCGARLLGANRVDWWLNLPAALLTHSFLGPNGQQLFSITLREVLFSAAAVALITILFALAWSSRKPIRNATHLVFLLSAVPIACLAFIPGYMVFLSKGAGLTGEGQAVMGWLTSISPDEDKSTWVRRSKSDATLFTMDEWYKDLPGVEYSFEVEEESALIRFQPKNTKAHRLILSLWLFLIPTGVYFLAHTLIWLVRNPVIPVCPDCRYNWTGISEGLCPGCKRPVIQGHES